MCPSRFASFFPPHFYHMTSPPRECCFRKVQWIRGHWGGVEDANQNTHTHTEYQRKKTSPEPSRSDVVLFVEVELVFQKKQQLGFLKGGKCHHGRFEADEEVLYRQLESLELGGLSALDAICFFLENFGSRQINLC